MAKVHRSIRLEESTAAAIREAAQAEGVSDSAYITAAIEARLNGGEAERGGEDAKEADATRELVDTLKDTMAMMRSQLEAKDEQIKALSAVAMGMQRRLEAAEAKAETVEAEAVSGDAATERRGLFARLFG